MTQNEFQQFLSLVKKSIDVLEKKSLDYNPDGNVFELFENISNELGIDVSTVIETQLLVKKNRIKNLQAKSDVNFESLKDSQIDAIGYSLLKSAWEIGDWLGLDGKRTLVVDWTKTANGCATVSYQYNEDSNSIVTNSKESDLKSQYIAKVNELFKDQRVRDLLVQRWREQLDLSYLNI